MKRNLLKLTMMVALMAAMAVGQAQNNVPITLDPGWNWISYPHSEPMSISEALSGFTPASGDIIKSKNSNARYANGRWIGTLTTLIPGQGYHYMSSDGTSRTFIFGGDAYDPTALPEEALDGEFTVDANGTKVRFSPGNLQCRADPNKEMVIQSGTGAEAVGYLPYYTYYCYSLCQMIYKADELNNAGLKAGPISSIALESYSNNHYLRNGVKVWMASTTLAEAPTTSVSTSGMTLVFDGSVTQKTGWTEFNLSSTLFSWDGVSNLIVVVVMNHGSWDTPTYWQCTNTGFNCSNYKYTDSSPYDPTTSTYSMTTSTMRPNTRFTGKGGATWRFAENQWDIIGDDNTCVSNFYNGWFDLFGWGTSGHPHGAVSYQPWSTSQHDNEYLAYGNDSYNLNEQTGEADWGCNPISNGGDKPNQWRTLTIEEWDYLLNTRPGKRYAKAQVNGMNGLILLPDGWSTSYYNLNATNNATADYTNNAINSTQWLGMEQHGAVFLPAAGAHFGSTMLSVGSAGFYWSASYHSSIGARVLIFSELNLGTQGSSNRFLGNPVRLVCQTNPRIRTMGVAGVTSTSATVGAEVDYTGTVTERGVCWNTTGGPTVYDDSQSSGLGTGGFSAELTNLTIGTTYYVRAYAKIDGIYRYGNAMSFTTKDGLTVSTAEVTYVTGTFAQCGGTISDCGQNITARGVCWSVYSNPTVSGNHTCDGKGTGSFTSMVDNLTEGTTYYVRAYATTANGTFYGETKTFTAASVMELTLSEVTNITSTTATFNYTVNNYGGNNVITARGLCWYDGGTPTVSNLHTNGGTGPGCFTSTLATFTPNRTYHVRAYATTAQGTTSYSNEQIFYTPSTATGQIIVYMVGVGSITATSAYCMGDVISDGGLTITARGICWGTGNNPTVNGSYTTCGSGTGSFSATLTGLTPNTTYYVRAFATTANGTTYGSQLSFTTEGSVTVTTADITNITTTTATCGGTVSGDLTVTARGVCWSTNYSPTINDSHTTNGSGTGSFTANLTGLTPNTTYYVRAYATTAQGTTYGYRDIFTTLSQTTVTTAEVTNITRYSAYCSGTVSGSLTVTDKGMCWNTSGNPTLNDDHVALGSGTGSISCVLNNLSSNTTYYVRAYATTADGTTYGNVQSFTTLIDGALEGLFSVSATQQVHFSQGNLQYRASTHTWRFAENQWDYCGGTANSNISSTYSGWIDLFAWGTSGFDHGAVCYQPWSASTASEDYSDYYAYGSATYNLYDQTGMADWGYNAISNGGNQTQRWRTLTQAEWQYLFNTRSTASGIRYAKAQVNGVWGMILLPDDWSTSYFVLLNANVPDASFSVNTLNASQWLVCESHGAVFLPAAGKRPYCYNWCGLDTGEKGYYWSASFYSNKFSECVSFFYNSSYFDDYENRCCGCSVRLVCPAE